MRQLFLRRTVGILAAVAFVVLAITVAWLRLGGAGAPTASAATITVEVGDFWFCSAAEDLGCERTINVGDTVSWDFGPASFTHTTTECAGSCGSFIGNPGSRLWHSGNRSSGTFEVPFNSPGSFEFHCNIHPTSMRGRIIVQGAPPTLPPPPPPVPTDTVVPPPTETPVPTLPPPPPPTATETGGPTLPPPPSPLPTDTPAAATDTPPAATATRTATSAPPTATPAGLVGDANDNGAVDSIDAALILQFGAGLLGSLANENAADANQNGSVDSIDAALVLQFVAGLLASLPP